LPRAERRAREQSRAGLFDHFVGAAKQRQRRGDAERLGGLEVDDQLDLRDLLDRKSAGFSPLRMRPT
jgi:hypothetical protein